MKTWLLKFRISNALDARKGLPTSVEKAAAQCEEARRLVANAKELDERLKNQSPEMEAPELMHEAIMRQVSAASRESEVGARSARPRWVMASGFAAVALACALGSVYFFNGNGGTREKGAEMPSFADAGTVFEVGGIVRGAPVAAMSPMFNEAQSLDLDFSNAKQFLIASLP